MKPGRCDGEVGVKSRCGAGSSKKLTVLPTTLACLLRLAGLNKRRRAENKKEKKKKKVSGMKEGGEAETQNKATLQHAWSGSLRLPAGCLSCWLALL